MSIQIGQAIPEVVLRHLGKGLECEDTRTLFANRKVVLFAVPGAFTPTCSEKHFPGYVEHFEAFRQRGIEVYCLAVNDPFVMRAWGHSLSAPAALRLLADGNGDFTRALGMDTDASGSGMGRRSRRFALYAEDGLVKALFVEEPGQFRVSAAEYVLAHLPTD